MRQLFIFLASFSSEGRCSRLTQSRHRLARRHKQDMELILPLPKLNLIIIKMPNKYFKCPPPPSGAIWRRQRTTFFPVTEAWTRKKKKKKEKKNQHHYALWLLELNFVNIKQATGRKSARRKSSLHQKATERVYVTLLCLLRSRQSCMWSSADARGARLAEGSQLAQSSASRDRQWRHSFDDGNLDAAIVFMCSQKKKKKGAVFTVWVTQVLSVTGLRS